MKRIYVPILQTCMGHFSQLRLKAKSPAVNSAHSDASAAHLCFHGHEQTVGANTVQVYEQKASHMPHTAVTFPAVRQVANCTAW